MAPSRLRIRALEKGDLADVIAWARAEHFAPAQGDVATYRHTDAAAVGLCSGRRDAEVYRGSLPAVPLGDVYGLACLELG